MIKLKFYIYFLFNCESKRSLSGEERVIDVSVFKKRVGRKESIERSGVNDNLQNTSQEGF